MTGLKYAQRFLFITFLFSVCLGGLGQSGAVNDIASRFKKYSEQRLQEKLYIHTDKSFYVCGEIVWFKLYNVDAYLNKPLLISKIAYVEFISPGQKPVLQAKIELNHGSGDGSFMLPFSLNSGVYILRAYTNWMKNFGPDLFFETPLTVINTLKKLPAAEADTLSPDIQFFPEGGNLVFGLQSEVGFHAVDKNGKGLACSGIIVNQNNDSVTSFESLRFGMGHFTLKPVSGNSFKAIVHTETGQTIIRNLPAAYERGFVMRLDYSDKENIRVSIHSNATDDPIFLLVHTRQSIKQAQTKPLKNGFAEFIVKKTELDEGISHFTLFNYQQQPVCERLYFRRPVQLEIGIATNEKTYSLRREVSIKLTSFINSQPTKANVSLSVFPADSLQSLRDKDILSYLWLSSDLNGIIESPLYYFDSADERIEEATDNLMLTHGWSRFKWEDINRNKKPFFQFLPEYEGPVISGRITEKSSGLPVKNVLAYLTVPDEKFILKTSVSDQSGTIIFNHDKFYGNKEIIVQLNDKMISAYNVDIAPPFISGFSSKKYYPFGNVEKWRDQLLSYSISSQVENAFIQNQRQQFHFPTLPDTTAFFGTPDKTYFLDDYTRFITVEEVMREYVPEIKVRKLNEQFAYRVKNAPYQAFFENDPLVLIDGLPVFDLNKLMLVDPLKIKRLDIVTRKFFSGKNAIEGIVSYGTYNGDFAGFQIDPNALVLDYAGLQLQREFYAPIYDTQEKAESRLPDFRNLLHWSPQITTNEKGESQISFYTSDRPGKYVVFVQGINSNGVAGSKVEFFTVTK